MSLRDDRKLIFHCFNPYFNGYSTLTPRTFEKTLYLLVLQRFFQTLKSHFWAYFLLFFAVFLAFSVTPSLHFYWLSIDFSLIFLLLVVVGIFTTNLFYHIFLIFQSFFFKNDRVKNIGAVIKYHNKLF